jgi:hypothetical protein
MSDIPPDAAGKNIDLAFADAILNDPNMLERIPDGATIVLIPKDDPEQAAYNIQLGVAAVEAGDDAYFLHVESLTVIAS